jgi:methionyl-tRNA formyltransferase
MDFSRPAMTLYNRWRGFQPWPGAWTILSGKKLAVHRMLPTEVRGGRGAQPGELLVEEGTMFAASGEGSWLELVEVQPEGKRRMTAGEFLRGHAVESGNRLG